MTSRARVEHSHLFPGVRVDLSPAPEDSSPELLGLGEVLLELGDGSMTTGELVADDDRRVLWVEPYETAAGTAIPAKAWSVVGHELTSRGVTLRLGQNLRRAHPGSS